MTWHALAACRGADPDLFFPERGEHLGESRSKIVQAKAVCRGCPVREQCLDEALRNNETQGVWGATSGRERRRMRSTMLASGQLSRAVSQLPPHGTERRYHRGCRCTTCTLAHRQAAAIRRGQRAIRRGVAS